MSHMKVKEAMKILLKQDYVKVETELINQVRLIAEKIAERMDRIELRAIELDQAGVLFRGHNCDKKAENGSLGWAKTYSVGHDFPQPDNIVEGGNFLLGRMAGVPHSVTGYLHTETGTGRPYPTKTDYTNFALNIDIILWTLEKHEKEALDEAEDLRDSLRRVLDGMNKEDITREEGISELERIVGERDRRQEPPKPETWIPRGRPEPHWEQDEAS